MLCKKTSDIVVSPGPDDVCVCSAVSLNVTLL